MPGIIEATRYHDISTGHKVTGHESKCAHLHGHNYRIHFFVQRKVDSLDAVGRVLDFSIIKEKLCAWVEANWDHKFLIWQQDPMWGALEEVDPTGVVVVVFNPTAENMAKYLVELIGPQQLPKECILAAVKIEETSKCAAMYWLAESAGPFPVVVSESK